MKNQLPSFDDDVELRLTKNVVHVLSGYTAEIAVTVLLKVLQSLLIGLSPDCGTATKHVATISKHLKKELRKQNPEDFGYLTKDAEDRPIITDEHGIRH